MSCRFAVTTIALLTACGLAEDPLPKKHENVTHRIVGLSEPGREADLRAALEKVPGVTLTSVDLELGEGVFSYDPAVAFNGTKPEKIVEKFNELLRNSSRQTFGILPLLTTPREKLTRVEIAVVPLDCKACALALHEILVRTDGVAQVLVSRKDGRITALIDSAMTNRAVLEEALKKREVRLAAP